MKRKVTCLFVLVAGLTPQAFASAGYAKDGFTFVMVLLVFLFLLAGLLKGFDYLNKNRKALSRLVRMKYRKLKSSRKRIPEDELCARVRHITGNYRPRISLE